MTRYTFKDSELIFCFICELLYLAFCYIYYIVFLMVSGHILWLCYKYIKITSIKSQCHKTYFSLKISSIWNISKYNLLAWQDIHLKIQNWSFVLFGNYFILFLLHVFYWFPIISVYIKIFFSWKISSISNIS